MLPEEGFPQPTHHGGQALAGVLFGFDVVVEGVAVLVPGCVIVAALVVAEQLQKPVSVRRTDAALSIGGDGFVRSDAEVGEHGAKLGGRLQGAHGAIERVQPFEMHGAGNASPALRAALVGASPLTVGADIPEDVVVVI